MFCVLLYKMGSILLGSSDEGGREGTLDNYILMVLSKLILFLYAS